MNERGKKIKKDNYKVKKVSDAKAIANQLILQYDLSNVVGFGLPEVDDRYHIWRIPLINKDKINIGEVVIDADTGEIDLTKSSSQVVLENRLLGRSSNQNSLIKESYISLPKKNKKSITSKSDVPKISVLPNIIGLGDSEELINELPDESVDLIFTSPPYFNARPEYADYITYDEYLEKIRRIIRNSHKVLNEGRFFIMNISPILIRRASRSEASRRIAVPFDFHKLFIEEGFEFVDDIHWVKPEGAGWATGRGRRFSADRTPLQYKPVPVTEYVLVYRKKTDKLIDWLIRKHPKPELVERSKIHGSYEVTNLWKIHPSYSKKHPAIFPIELAEKVIKYYSFEEDVVMDPFGGIGTVAKAAIKNNRRFVHFELSSEYMDVLLQDLSNWSELEENNVNCINCSFSINSNLFTENV
jgi:DNA modification methylase